MTKACSYLVILASFILLLLAVVPVADASAQSVVWSLRSATEPTVFSPNDDFICSEGIHESCDSYQILATNIGDNASIGQLTMIDELPVGIEPKSILSGTNSGTEFEEEWSCAKSEAAGKWTVTCHFEEAVSVGGYAPSLSINVSSPKVSSGTLENVVTVSGGGAPSPVQTTTSTKISNTPPTFELNDFSVLPTEGDGSASSQAGGHPWNLSTTFKIPSVISAPDSISSYRPQKNLKTVMAELPPGFIGNPHATPDCVPAQLRLDQCPRASRVGTLALLAAGISAGEFGYSGGNASEPPSAVYKMVNERGYPAVLGFTYANFAVYLYASVVRDQTGYHVRITTQGIPSLLETDYVALRIFGNPGQVNETEETGPLPRTAFLTNPANCLAGGPSSKTKLETVLWEDPTNPISAETTAYPTLTGCANLHFDPSLEVGPSSPGPEEGTSQSDAPSAYTVDLKVPQTEDFEELATPPLKDAVVTLPAGVSVNPAAAQGLVGCAATGPEGINIGSDEIGPLGQDLGDPEATELGAGHAGGNNSPYDDGVYHTAKGHCPLASTLGTVEVFTPLLPTRCGGEEQPACKEGESPAPLQGHIYLAQPKCGGSGQPACTEADATNGNLYSGYIEVEGSGVIVKIPGTISADPSTGQLTGSFKENPQFPFSEFKLHFHGGPRAPVANPQSCGSFTPTSTLSSWAAPELPATSPTSPAFGIDWDGKGGACPGTNPFAPAFSAGSTNPTAGAYSPFVLTFSRQDREQDLSGITQTLPPGLIGKLAGIPRCGEAQANAGTCGAESLLGSARVLAGPGASPLPVGGGRVYLTDGYKGAPFGLSIVQPAVAGPFNLGNVIVRAAIRIDPNTAQVTVTSDPLPQIKDGVPFRLRTVNVTIDRPGFILNPTSCTQKQITATISAAQGASAAVSSPFAVAGCSNLPFKPSFSASTQGKTSKANGASLNVKVAQKPGEANIQKVQLQLPKALPSRLTTLQKACTEAQFNSNPASCPEASNIGTATAHTPLLDAPLTGPAYLVSHGAAAFPDVEFLLQGEGVEIILDGKTDIKGGITYSRFETVPDAPISSFETNLPESPHSVLAANGDLCSLKLTAPTTIVSQSGATVTQSTPIPVSGCAKAQVKILKLKRKRNGTIAVTFSLNRAGTVTFSGKGLKKLKRSFAAGTHQVNLKLSRAGRKLHRHHRRSTLKLSLSGAGGSAQAGRGLRL